MRYSPEHREESRRRVLLAAGRCFRKQGYEGVGVDGLAKEAGVTSGSFYWHFPSKEAAFKEAVETGMRELRDGVEGFQAELGLKWLEAFVDFYLGSKRTCDLTESCALQSLTPEVIRSTAEVRTAYEAQLESVIDAVAKGLSGGTAADRRGRAWALMSLLSGAVTTARAVDDPTVRLSIAKSARAAAIAIARPVAGGL